MLKNKNMTDKNSPKNNETISVFLNVFLIVIWSFWFSVLCLWFLSQNIEIDKVGDAFNILWAVTWTIAVVLVYLTYKTQKEELSLTRQELKNSAEMMRQQKEIMDEERKIMEEEKFRNHFSFLLEQKEKIKNNIIYLDKPKNEELRGEKFFIVSAEIISDLNEFEWLYDDELVKRWISLARYCNNNKQQLEWYQEFLNLIKKESLRNNDFTLIYDTTVSEDEKFFFERIWNFVGEYYPQEK